MPPERKKEIINHLFPDRRDSWIHPQELEVISKKIKPNKAPGLDRIPSEAIKIALQVLPSIMLNMFNDLLRPHQFPDMWKRAKVVLLLKQGKSMEEVSSFKAICLLDGLGKTYEALIKGRLEDAINQSGGLSDFQFGFQAEKSRIQALDWIKEKVKATRTTWSILICIDIKNAFNSVS